MPFRTSSRRFSRDLPIARREPGSLRALRMGRRPEATVGLSPQTDASRRSASRADALPADR